MCWLVGCRYRNCTLGIDGKDGYRTGYSRYDCIMGLDVGGSEM